MSALQDILAKRPDLSTLIAQGILALINYILQLERERDEALARSRMRTPIGDSRTTHAPPSTDPRGKRRSQRRRSSRKSGGQPGHAGHRLEPSEKPDKVVKHKLNRCGSCEIDLRKQAAESESVHQVFDLQQMPLFVTEHRCEKKTCPRCLKSQQAKPPPGAEQPTQYGPRLMAMAVYLNIGQFVPLKRTVDIIATITGHKVSEGWVSTCRKRTAQRLGSFKKSVIQALRAAPSLCCDETGFRFAGHRFWMHVCCTVTLTLLLCHRRRGLEAINDMEVLNGYTGVAIHDHWKSYFSYTNCEHGVCNEHLVRELDGVFVRDSARWAQRLKIVLYDGLELKRKFHHQGLPIPPNLIASIIKRYHKWINVGYEATPVPEQTSNTRRRPSRGKTLCLLDRLINYEKETLSFLYNMDVPWSNNQAERDIRPMKTLMKIIGGFRTQKGAEEFCDIRSYLSTTQKNDIHPFDAIECALAGNPWLPQLPETPSVHDKTVAA